MPKDQREKEHGIITKNVSEKGKSVLLFKDKKTGYAVIYDTTVVCETEEKEIAQAVYNSVRKL